jgi:hypothetical protein
VNRDNSGGIATGYGLEERGSIPGRGKVFLFSVVSIQAMGPTHTPMSIGARFPEVKRPGREADSSPPSSALVKTGGIMIPLFHMPSWCGA